jgi:phosphopantetheinyl transferase
MMSYWERVDERLIKRGMLIMDLDFVRGYRDELVRMNRRKRGRPYRIAESYVRFLAVISRKRGHLKIHLAIDARTGEIVYFERTTDRIHDSEAARRMVDRSMEAGNVIKVIGDGAYDPIRLIRHLERRGYRTYYKAEEECQDGQRASLQKVCSQDDKGLRVQSLEQNSGIW